MGEYIVDQAFAYLGGHDFTVDANQWDGGSSFEVLDKTVFRNNNGARWFRGGLFSTTLSIGGFADLDEYGNDIELWNAHVGKTIKVVTGGNIETEGEPAIFTRSLVSTFNPGGGGPIGQLAPLTMSAVGSDRYGLIRGLLFAAAQTVTTTGAKGTALQLGAVDADQRLFSTLHLLGEPGTSITVVLESDSDNTFASATTRGTFGPLTAAGGNWLTPVAGPITDTWWRFRVTAITGSWDIAAAAGIE